MTMIADNPKTSTRGPAPVVCYGQILNVPEHPGVSFVLPLPAEQVGGPQSDLGWSIPLVIATCQSRT